MPRLLDLRGSDPALNHARLPSETERVPLWGGSRARDQWCDLTLSEVHAVPHAAIPSLVVEEDRLLSHAHAADD